MAQPASERGESGQSLILFAFLLMAVLGFTAAAVDVGRFFVDRRTFQTTADAAALAAVQDLPGSPDSAVTAARVWAAKNGAGQAGSGISVRVTTPYRGDATAVEVVVEGDVPFMFARALGMKSAHVTARAVAAREDGDAYAIYAHGRQCGSDVWELEITGSHLDVEGAIHTNGDGKINSSDGEVEGAVTYVCSLNTGGQPLVVEGGSHRMSTPLGWPVSFEYSDFEPCSFYSSGDLNINQNTRQYWVGESSSGGVLKPGVYCADGDIKLSGASFSGNVTFVARNEVHFSGSTFNFTPFRNGVLAFAGKSDPGCTRGRCDLDPAIHVSTSSFTWEGILFAPRYTAQFSASTGSSENGSIMAEFVKLSGSQMHVEAWDEGEAGPPRLVE